MPAQQDTVPEQARGGGMGPASHVRAPVSRPSRLTTMLSIACRQ